MPHLKRTATGVLGGFAGLVGLSALAGILVTATVTPAIAVSGYAASSALDSFENMPSFLEIDPLMLPTEIYRKDNAGNDVLMAQFYDQNRIPVTFDQVNPVMYDAIISSEDKNFYTHGGVDIVGTLSALAGNAVSGSDRGGSSITQQYVKNILQQNCESEAKGDTDKVKACYTTTTVSKGSDGYQRKLQEMRYAIQLEKRSSKDEILVGYLNITNFGGLVYGVGAAAQYYFGTDAAHLSIAQAATIAGMVKEPNTYRIDKPGGSATDKAGKALNGEADGYKLTLDRRNYVLKRMLEDGKISQAEYKEAKETPITPVITPRDQGCRMATGAEFFCEAVVSQIKNDPAFGDAETAVAALRRGGLKIYTTLDPDLQQAALNAISIVPATVSYMDLGSSGVQIEVGTGRVLSMVQNRPYSPTGEEAGTTPVNYNVREANGGSIGHPAGSTYKVFSLLNWLQQGRSVNEAINGRVGVKTVQTCDGATQQVAADNTGLPNHVANFEQNPGYTGSIYNFTRDSLNSGFLAMAEQISVCSTNEVAGQLGVTWGDGTPLTEVPSWSTSPANAPYNVLGSSAVAPVDMAAAYATIAANGQWCQPKYIDKALDKDGKDITPPTTCERRLSEAVASTAAYTLVGVMSGTGIGARIGDGVPVFGKTGIHQYEQTWMDGASTKVATVVWVGNANAVNGVNAKLNEHYENGYPLHRIRNAIWPKMQGAANAKFGGDNFPTPDAALIKQVLRDLPSVIGMSVDEATKTLTNAGFSVSVGDAVDGVESAGTVIQQSPGAGRAAGGSTITINPSNGNGVVVPAVNGKPDDAVKALRGAGFDQVDTQCTETDGAPDGETVTGTNPSAGTVVSRATKITVLFQAKKCP